MHELVDRVSAADASKYALNPFSKIREEVELRVMRIMFLKQFSLDRCG